MTTSHSCLDGHGKTRSLFYAIKILFKLKCDYWVDQGRSILPVGASNTSVNIFHMAGTQEISYLHLYSCRLHLASQNWWKQKQNYRSRTDVNGAFKVDQSLTAGIFRTTFPENKRSLAVSLNVWFQTFFSFKKWPLTVYLPRLIQIWTFDPSNSQCLI